jgi:hypothetical protein
VQFYNYNIELPFCRESISFREISTKEQISLVKANLAFPNNQNNHFEYNNCILDILSNCIKNKDILKNLNIIDYVLFVTKLRIISIGSNIDLITQSNNKEFKKSKTTLDLNVFLKNLYISSISLVEDNIIKDNDIEIEISWPSLDSIKLFQKLMIDNKNQYETFLSSYQEFIKTITYKESLIDFKNFNSDEKIRIIEKLSLSLLKKVQEKILEHIKILTKTDMWGVSTFKEYTFNFHNLSFIEFIKLFFSNDLRELYKEICFFASNNLSCDYILNISPVERKIHYSLVIEQLNERNKESVPDFEKMSLNGSKELQELAAEFGET